MVPYPVMSECPFLQGRGFVFASQFSRLLPQEIAGEYLDAAIRVIENDNAQIPIKVSAVKAIQKYVPFYSQFPLLSLFILVSVKILPIHFWNRLHLASQKILDHSYSSLPKIPLLWSLKLCRLLWR